MTKIPFTPKENRADRKPTGPGGKPQEVHWWRKAPPPPYLLVLIKVREISADGNRLLCMLFGPESGNEVEGPLWIDLTDQKNVWTGLPSTYVRNELKIGERDHVVMCFARAWLEVNAKKVAGEITEANTGNLKWPWGETGPLNDTFRAAAKDLANKLREGQEKLAAIETLVRKLRDRPEKHGDVGDLAGKLAGVEELVRKLRENSGPEQIKSYQEIQQLL